MNTQTHSEKELVRRLQNADDEASHLVYRRYVRYLSAVCSRYIASDEDAKDVLQESFLKIFSSLDSFTYKGEGSLRAWMSRVVLSESIKWLRQNNRLQCVEMSDEVLHIPDTEPDTGGVSSDAIYNMIRSLPDGYRTVFNLYVIEEKSHREIAELLGIKESSSASQLHRAKALLAEMITNHKANKDRHS